MLYSLIMYIKVKVKAGQNKEEVKKVNENTFDISVKEKAKGNMANTRVIELVAKELKVKEGKVRIINGHHHPSKLISINQDTE